MSHDNLGLAGLNNLPEKPERKQKPSIIKVTKLKSKSDLKEESFIKWYAKNKRNLQEEFPEMIDGEVLKLGLTRYKEGMRQSHAGDTPAESPKGVLKKRKLPSPDREHDNEAKRSTSSASVLSKFAFSK